jgi:hypothetical protein
MFIDMLESSEVVLLFIFGTTFAFCSIFLGVTLESYKFAHQVLVYIHNSSIVVEVPAIVFGGENGY